MQLIRALECLGEAEPVHALEPLTGINVDGRLLPSDALGAEAMRTPMAPMPRVPREHAFFNHDNSIKP